MTLAQPGNDTAAGLTPRSRNLIALALALIAIGVYANAIHNGFAFDDRFIIVENTTIHSLRDLPAALLSRYWPPAPSRAALYRPLTTASYAIGWSLWHGNPHGFHLVNALLHGLVTVFVLLLLLRLGAPLVAAAAGALVFAVHPVHTEAVANVVGRAEILAALFFIGAMVEYLDPRLGRWRRALVVGLAFLLALGSKENAATLPGVLFVLELARRDRRGMPWSERIRREWPVALAVIVVMVGYAALRHHVLGVFLGNDEAPYLAVLPHWERLLTAIRLFPEYVRLAVFPKDLIVEYGPAVIIPVRGLGVMLVLGFVLAVVAIAAVIGSWKHQRLFAVGILWFALTLIPASNLIVTVGITMAERTLYLPSVGWSILLAGLVVEVARGVRPAGRRALAAVGLVMVLLGAWRTWERNPVWRSTDTMLDDLAAHHPESFRAQWYLGERYEKAGDGAKSLFYFRRAAAQAGPYYPLLIAYVRSLFAFHQYQEAIPVLRRIVRWAPEYRDGQVLLGAGLIILNQWKEAREALEAAVNVNPHDADLYSLLAVADASSGDLQAALTARLASIRYAGPRAAPADWEQLAYIRGRMGQMDQAEAALQRARTLAGDTLTVPPLDSLLASPGGVGLKKIEFP